MGFLAPIAGLVAAGILIPSLLFFYFLKLRRQPMAISSTLLWKKAVQDLQVNAPFQRMRKSLLLLIQFLLLIGLLFAFARPTVSSVGDMGERVVIVIDRSGSMSATDVKPSRIDQAKRLANELVDKAAENQLKGGVMVLTFAQSARIESPYSGDKAQLHAQINSISSTDERSNIEPAMKLLEREAQDAATTNAPLTVYVISDGRVSSADKTSLPGAKIQYLTVGKGAPIDTTVKRTTAEAELARQASATQPAGAPGAGTSPDTVSMGSPDWPDNLGFTAFSARRDYKSPEKVQVLATLCNFGPKAITANVTLSVDSVPARTVPVTIPPALGQASGYEPGVLPVRFDLELIGSPLIQVTHDHKDDLLSDNSAWFTLFERKQLRVLMVSPVISSGNPFLTQVMRALDVKKLVTIDSRLYEDSNPAKLTRAGWPGAQLPTSATSGGAGDGFDVIVFDRYSPTAVPQIDSLYFDALPPIPGLKSLPAQPTDNNVQRLLNWNRDHVLLRYVGLDDLIFQSPRRLALPETAEALAIARSGPMMAVVTHQGTRHVVVGVDIIKSNWPMMIGFPIFMNNVLPWLAMGGQSEAGIAYTPGQVAAIPVSGALTKIAYNGPIPLETKVENGRAILPMFSRVGLYLTPAASPKTPGAEQPWDRIGVNLLDANESDLRVAQDLQIGSTLTKGQAGNSVVKKEIWPWFVLAALALLMLEWIVYTRRMSL
jgi:hypothetical protein